MTYDTVEESVQDAAPVELYSFIAPAFAFYLTSHVTDVNYGGFLYKATPQARSSISVVDQGTDQSDITVEVPASHALPVAYAAGIPVRELYVTITRYHPESAVALIMWQGYASGMSYSKSTDGPMFSFRIPNGTGDTLDLEIPSVLATRICNKILYDDFCGVVRASFAVLTTIASISSDGRTINVAAMGGHPNDWATHGEIAHVNTSERRTVTRQTGNAVGIQCQFPNGTINIGDSIFVFAGCDHRLITCKQKFANHRNYGGLWYMPATNVFYVGLVNARYYS